MSTTLISELLAASRSCELLARYQAEAGAITASRVSEKEAARLRLRVERVRESLATFADPAPGDEASLWWVNHIAGTMPEQRIAARKGEP